MSTAVNFADEPEGAQPRGWISTCTGMGEPRWTVERDVTATAASKIVRQSGHGKFPLLLRKNTKIRDGFIEAKFKTVAGSRDRAAGLVWRAQDANNYYVARANALEDNVVLYKVAAGVRSPLDIVGRKGGYGVDVSVPTGRWLALRVEFRSSRFQVSYDGKLLFEVEDSTFVDGGQVGLWTKADSVTQFDEIAFGDLA
jgi:hypothetical protein